MKRSVLTLTMCVLTLLLMSAWLAAEDTAAKNKGDVNLNRLITFNGTLKDSGGIPRFGISGVTFSLYASQEGGDPLWRESQVVQSDEQGRYTVLLGATEKVGMPLEVFGTGKAQWLGIQPEGQEEQARVLLMAVPYALKAADADTVGGKPLSSFVLYEDLAKAEEKSRTASVIIGTGTAAGQARQAAAGSSATDAAVQAVTGSTGRVLSSEVGTNSWFGEGRRGITGGAVEQFDVRVQRREQTSRTGITTLSGWICRLQDHDRHYNTIVGLSSGHENTTGSNNTFVGFWSGGANTAGSDNTFVGINSGLGNTASGNSFFGSNAGHNNTTGANNAFFGYQAGNSNLVGGSNAFFGYQAGFTNTSSGNSFFGGGSGYSNNSGSNNVFVGTGAGFANTTGSQNSGLGRQAGEKNTSGVYNTFLGYLSGRLNTTGDHNLFAGYYTGGSNTIENNNSFIGNYSNGVAGITNATAVGYRASVGASNSLVLGSISGVNGAAADTYVGIGTTTPTRLLEVRKDQAASTYFQVTNLNDSIDVSRSRFALVAGTVTQEMQSIAKDGGYFGTTSNHPFRIYTNKNTRMTVDANGYVGINTIAPTERLHVVGNLRVQGTIINSAPEGDLPDYVFEKDYRLMPLGELQEYLAREKHLPNVPSAAEMKEKGVNLSAFQMRLLEKIEELTLYAVQQGNTIREKEADIAALAARLAALEQAEAQRR